LEGGGERRGTILFFDLGLRKKKKKGKGGNDRFYPTKTLFFLPFSADTRFERKEDGGKEEEKNLSLIQLVE